MLLGTFLWADHMGVAGIELVTVTKVMLVVATTAVELGKKEINSASQFHNSMYH